ncbi:hypothetical protein GCM10027591_09660 [Zhihengliuella somnathii]
MGGGVMRDVVANETPQLFNPRGVYAIPAMLGASLTVGALELGWFTTWVCVGIAAAVFALRGLSLKFGWHIPLAGGGTVKGSGRT